MAKIPLVDYCDLVFQGQNHRALAHSSSLVAAKCSISLSARIATLANSNKSAGSSSLTILPFVAPLRYLWTEAFVVKREANWSKITIIAQPHNHCCCWHLAGIPTLIALLGGKAEISQKI